VSSCGLEHAAAVPAVHTTVCAQRAGVVASLTLIFNIIDGNARLYGHYHTRAPLTCVLAEVFAVRYDLNLSGMVSEFNMC
jgi:hypothetical protein